MAESNLAAPVGLPLDRVDGRLKVTGKATYAYEYAAQGAAALRRHRYRVDRQRAASSRWTCRMRSSAPGVRLVLTKDNAPPQHPFGPVDLPDRFARADAGAQ